MGSTGLVLLRGERSSKDDLRVLFRQWMRGVWGSRVRLISWTDVFGMVSIWHGPISAGWIAISCFRVLCVSTSLVGLNLLVVVVLETELTGCRVGC